jgi:hypothetical protein
LPQLQIGRDRITAVDELGFGRSTKPIYGDATPTANMSSPAPHALAIEKVNPQPPKKSHPSLLLQLVIVATMQPDEGTLTSLPKFFQPGS